MFHYKNQQTFTALWVHLVWSTKHRESLILPNFKYQLYDFIRLTSQKKDYHLDFINGVEDHIHLLYSLKPTQNVSTLVKDIKGTSWAWMKKNKLSKTYFTWQDGYAAISVSPQNVQLVRNYIKKQEKHHEKFTFQDEMKKFKNAVIIPPFDEIIK